MSKETRVLGDLSISLEPHKENEYDRGTKKVVVNGVQWGWIRTTWHGMHGTQFHLSDMHGTVHQPHPTSRDPGHMVEAKCSSPKKRQKRFHNALSREEDKVPIPTSEGLILDMIAEAIENRWFRNPDERSREIVQNREAMRIRQAQLATKAETAWKNRIDEIVKLGKATASDSLEFEADALREAISDAMKWAQVQ